MVIEVADGSSARMSDLVWLTVVVANTTRVIAAVVVDGPQPPNYTLLLGKHWMKNVGLIGDHGKGLSSRLVSIKCAVRYQSSALMRLDSFVFRLVLDESVSDISLSSLASLDSLCVFTCWICLLLPFEIWTQSYFLAPPERSTMAKSGGSILTFPKLKQIGKDAASVPFKKLLPRNNSTKSNTEKG
ncbi:hypothetical protein PENFLA_c019G01033 [Penicillium flavigenum]|uniref:Uncharacterized protein n=1 Tax=Penicillium flavigenum TaxID=254877 RepID=A0A1V6SYS0_9EURO|nr:hypothetical protein PENFLA_c019G01033 [Penicillium flavigenum]